MINLIHRELTVDAPLETAWDHLAQVEAWPSWARHIRSVALEPPGPMGPASSGSFRLANGVKSDFNWLNSTPG